MCFMPAKTWLWSDIPWEMHCYGVWELEYGKGRKEDRYNDFTCGACTKLSNFQSRRPKMAPRHTPLVFALAPVTYFCSKNFSALAQRDVVPCAMPGTEFSQLWSSWPTGM